MHTQKHDHTKKCTLYKQHIHTYILHNIYYILCTLDTHKEKQNHAFLYVQLGPYNLIKFSLYFI